MSRERSRSPELLLTVGWSVPQWWWFYVAYRPPIFINRSISVANFTASEQITRLMIPAVKPASTESEAAKLITTIRSLPIMG